MTNHIVSAQSSFDSRLTSYTVFPKLRNHVETTMITIKKDRGWENPQSWEEVESLPGYTKNVNPKEVKLKDVIGKYREPELRVCGLSTCHTKHFRGYLVSTIDGHVTNIGVDCGTTHFGVDFETMSRQLDREWQLQQYREAIASAQHRVPDWTAQCDDLLNGERAAAWLSKQQRAMQDRNTGLPESILKVLSVLMRSGSDLLVKERVATEREREIARETGQTSPDFLREEVGVLHGVAGLNRLEELRALLPRDLIPNLKALSDVDVNMASDDDLRRWSKWSGEIDAKISQAASIIHEAERFFTRTNIARLAEICTTNKDEHSVMAFARRCD